MGEHVDTICVQGGYQPGNGESRTPPIIQATTFKYTSSEQMSRLFDLSETGYFYSRLQNPTCDLVAAKICEMEGGVAAMLTSSGQAANFFALFNICNEGDHIVASSAIYGGTFNLINVTMRKMGITCTFVNPDPMLIACIVHAEEEARQKRAYHYNHGSLGIDAVVDMYCPRLCRSRFGGVEECYSTIA